MVRHTARVGTLTRHELEHRQEEIADATGLFDAEVVFLAEHVGQGPVAEAMDIAELAFAVEDFLRPLAADTQGFGEGAEELDDLCDVVVVFAVFGAGLGVEEVVACDEFEGLGWVVSRLSYDEMEILESTYHSSHTPDVRTGTPLRPKDYLWRTVLSCLNVICKVVSNPACITQIGDLD